MENDRLPPSCTSLVQELAHDGAANRTVYGDGRKSDVGVPVNFVSIVRTVAVYGITVVKNMQKIILLRAHFINVPESPPW